MPSCPLCLEDLTAVSKQAGNPLSIQEQSLPPNIPTDMYEFYCVQCQGAWITQQAFLKYFNEATQDALSPVTPSTDFCPMCGPVPLDQGVFRQVEGRVCSECHGVFLKQLIILDTSTPILDTTPATIKPTLIPTVEPTPTVEPVRSISAIAHPIEKPSTPIDQTSKSTNTPEHRTDLQKDPKIKASMKEILWITFLFLCIILSLLYSMNP